MSAGRVVVTRLDLRECPPPIAGCGFTQMVYRQAEPDREARTKARNSIVRRAGKCSSNITTPATGVSAANTASRETKRAETPMSSTGTSLRRGLPDLPLVAIGGLPAPKGGVRVERRPTSDTAPLKAAAVAAEIYIPTWNERSDGARKERVSWRADVDRHRASGSKVPSASSRIWVPVLQGSSVAKPAREVGRRRQAACLGTSGLRWCRAATSTGTRRLRQNKGGTKARSGACRARQGRTCGAPRDAPRLGSLTRVETFQPAAPADVHDEGRQSENDALRTKSLLADVRFLRA
jgi:hypothetical protein